jgi:hypothetical protein
MTMGYATTLRTARAAAIRAAIDAGPAAGYIEFYDGARPATGAAVTSQVLLATCTCSDPSGSESNGVLTFGAIGNGTGTAGATVGGTAEAYLITVTATMASGPVIVGSAILPIQEGGA